MLILGSGHGFAATEINLSNSFASHDPFGTAAPQQANSVFEGMTAFPLSAEQGTVAPMKATGKPAQSIPFNGAAGQHGGQGMSPSAGPWIPGAFEALQTQVGEAAAVRKSAELEQKLNSALVEIARLNGRLAKGDLENQPDSDMDDSDDDPEDETLQKKPDALHIPNHLITGEPCDKGCYHCPLNSCDETKKSRRDMK